MKSSRSRGDQYAIWWHREVKADRVKPEPTAETRLPTMKLFSRRTAGLAVMCVLLITVNFVYHSSQLQSRWMSTLFSSGCDDWSSAGVGTHSNETGDAATKMRTPAEVFQLTFPGFPVSCNDTVPTQDDLQAMTVECGFVEMTHTACCDGVGSRGGMDSGPKTICRSARKPLRIPLKLAKAALASGERSAELDKLDLLHSLVFITAASSDHFEESLVLVKSVQTFFPNHTLLYWDLGLSSDQAAALKTFCGVTYRRFDKSKYPEHVATLKTYAFKPLVIMESFSESHPILWWVDASVRFNSSHVDHALALMRERHGFVMYRDYNHSVWSATYPQMYDYVATSVESLKLAATVTGASFLVANTREFFSMVLFWYYACALDQRCIAPIMYSGDCDLKTFDYFAKCHRFDQSLLTILLTNVWGFHTDGFRFAQDMFFILRTPDGDKAVQSCSDGRARPQF